MKKLKYLLFALFMMIPFSVSAGSVSVSLSCPGSANAGSEVTCNVNVSSDVAVNGLSANYSLSGASYVSFTPQNGFTSYNASGSGFAIGNTAGKSGSYTIGVLKVKVNSAATIQLININASDTDFGDYNIGGQSRSIRINSTNNNLGGLSLSNGTLSPSFSAGTTNYTATIDADNVVINASKSEDSQSISGAGSKALNYGNNTFNIVVTSESGSSKTYTITINRPDNRSTNNNLKNLSVNQGSISFNKNTTSYSIDVDSNVSSIKVTAALEDSSASFVNGFGSRTVDLSYGNNVILVKVQAQNGAVKTYTINVNRKDDRSTNNDLKTLKVSSGEVVFDKDTLEYNVSVYYDVTTFDIKATAVDEKAVVKVNGPSELAVGENIFTIDVTSENGNVKTYKIIVKRLSEDEKMSDDNGIASLKIFGHDIDFSNDVYEYTIEIGKDETELFFDIVLEDDKANYTIKNNENLKDGSEVILVVVSESGLKNEYTFIIEQENVLISYIIVGGICLVVGIFLGIIISKRPKKNKDKNKNNINSEPVIVESTPVVTKVVSTNTNNVNNEAKSETVVTTDTNTHTNNVEVKTENNPNELKNTL